MHFKKQIKNEIKALKVLEVEYLQSEYIFKLDPAKESLKESLNELNVKSNDHISEKYLNFIMPLICYVESTSWILVGTPITYLKTKEDPKIKECSYYFKNSLFLRNLSMKNLRFHSRINDESANIPHTPNSSAIFGPSNSINAIITNVEGILPKLRDACLLYIINQDLFSNVVYIDPPE